LISGSVKLTDAGHFINSIVDLTVLVEYFNIRTFIHKRLVFCLCECKPNCYTSYPNFLVFFD